MFSGLRNFFFLLNYLNSYWTAQLQTQVIAMIFRYENSCCDCAVSNNGADQTMQQWRLICIFELHIIIAI